MLRKTTWHSGYTGNKMKSKRHTPLEVEAMLDTTGLSRCASFPWRKDESMKKYQSLTCIDWSLSYVEIFRQLRRKQFTLVISLNVSWELGCTWWFCPCSVITHEHVALFIVHQNSPRQSNVQQECHFGKVTLSAKIQKWMHVTNLTEILHMKDQRHSPEWLVRLSHHFPGKPTHLKIISLHVHGHEGEKIQTWNTALHPL